MKDDPKGQHDNEINTRFTCSVLILATVKMQMADVLSETNDGPRKTIQAIWIYIFCQ